MTQQGDELTPLRQRWLPQTSIRFFIALIALCAIGMYTFRAAIIGGQQWAKIASLLIATSLGCFFVYAGLFFVAYLFSTATSLTWNAVSWRPRSAEDRASHRGSGEN